MVVVVVRRARTRALLLLRSANDAHPNGLANGSDQVGRNYMRHNNVAMMALSKEPNPTPFQKTLALNDWYLKGEDTDYPWGGIQMLGKSDGEQLQGQGAALPRVGREAHAGAPGADDRAPQRRLLAVVGGPPAPRQPASPSAATAR